MNFPEPRDANAAPSIPSETSDTGCASDPEIASQWGTLIATGQLPLLVALEHPDRAEIFCVVGRERRRRLLRLIAEQIARDALRLSSRNTERSKNVKESI